ncbi:MAG: AsmA family protein [Alphaproteobacteria bacterium]
MKKAAYGLGGLVVLLIAAALIVPSLIDWNAYKPDIAAEAEKATGRTLDIAGDLELGILPTPHVRVSDVRFANAPGGTAAHMATLKELRASVKLLPLLTGSIEIASVELIEPVIELEKRADGSGNWEFAPPAGKPGGSGPSATPGPGGDKTDPQALRPDLLRIERGTIVYRDAATGSVQRLENLTADLSAGSLTGPFTIRGGLRTMGVSLTVDGRVGKFAEKSAIPFDIAFGTPATNTRIGLKGNVTDVETAPAVSARLEGKGDNLGALVGALSGAPAPALLGRPFSVAASVKGGGDAFGVNGIAISLGSSKISGDIAARLKDTPEIDVSLRSGTLDVDEWLSAAQSTPAPSAADTSGTAIDTPPTGATPAAPAAAQTPPAGLPADIRVNLTATVAEAIVRKGRVRDIRLEAALANGTLTLNTLTAALPGAARVNASGRLTSPGGVMTFAGKSSFETASLRTLLQWLDVDVGHVPADRLRRFALSSDISATAQQVQIANISGQMDASRMSGGVTLALRDRPAFGASFSIDQVNIDAYLGKPPAAAAKPAGGDTAPPPGTASTAAPGNTASPGPLAVLNEFDANLQMRVGNLTYQRTAIRDIRFDGTLVNGALTLRDASVRNLAGTSVNLAGTVSGLEAIPRFNGTVSAASNDLTGLFRVAGIESSVAPRQLGKMRLTARTTVARNRVNLNADLQLAGARTTVKGTLDGLAAAPVFDLSLNSRHPEMAQLAALLSGGRPGPKAGPVTVKAKLKGDLNAVDIDASTGMTGGVLKIAGRIDALATTPRLNIGVDLNQPDFVKFVRAFEPGYTPSRRQLGALKLTARLQGTDRDLSIRDLAGNIGPARISGSGTYIDRAPRPAVNLVLKSSAIPLSDFLEAPAQTGTARATGANRPATASGPSSGSGGRWSREKIDTAALGLVDAEIDLGADALLYKSYRVDQPKILASLKNRVLDVRQIAGKMFDGSFEMKARMDGRKTPEVQATIRVADARVDNAFFAGDSFDVEAGNLSHDLAFTTRGNSQYELIRGLNGNGSLTVTDGVVRGFDLQALNRSLRGGGLRNLASLIPAAAASIGKSRTTKFSSLKGTIQIANGVVSTRDALLISDGGDISAAGTVNLPAWDINMIADIRPRKVREIPKLRVTLTGPPDLPNPRFNFDELTKDAITQGIGGLLKKVLPGAKSGSGSGQTQQEQQQPQQADPAQELIKNIFKGLGR